MYNIFSGSQSGPILEGKGMRPIFQKKGRGKYLKIWAKMYKI